MAELQLSDPIVAEWADELADLQFLLLLEAQDISNQVI
jgi:hypothetical protein